MSSGPDPLFSVAQDLSTALRDFGRNNQSCDVIALDVWKTRGMMYLGALLKAYSFLRLRNDPFVTVARIYSNFDLTCLECFVWQRSAPPWRGGTDESWKFGQKYGENWWRVIAPLQDYVISIPGYKADRFSQQSQESRYLHKTLTGQLSMLYGRRDIDSSGSAAAERLLEIHLKESAL